MRWSTIVGGVALLVAGLAGPAQAQYYHPPQPYQPYSPGYVIPPGCATPSPSVVIPPGVTPPSPGMPSPGTTRPGTPGSPGTPSTPGTPGTPGTGTPGTGTPGTGTPGANTSGMGDTGMGQGQPSTGADNVSASSPEAGSSAVASSAPNMIGDFGIGPVGVLRGVSLSSNSSSSSSSSSVKFAIANRYQGVKIAENESPRPQTRVFATYNYFNQAAALPGGTPTFNIHRELMGFEAAFLDGSASIGMRLPVTQMDGGGGGGSQVDGFGNLTTIFKYAFVNNYQTGDVLSGGMAVTAPTGRDVVLADGTKLNGVLLQPYAGWIYNMDRLYTLGFTSVVIPTQGQDVTFYAADLGFGYRLYQACDCNATLTQVIPIAEFHANIPLNHVGTTGGGLIGMPYQYVATGGVQIGLWNSAFLAVGLAVPVSGPRPYNYELLTQFNLRF